ncbi:unnamed protein product [Dibothriocephalus latus]|uniref:G-protein coupled receptors family 1 profile domain-containing protein n=1 Tax=Dibothriocephalus latus TaxID=60516 RepID=A0A3P7LR68_DIBLA|nr:unnamed protein product [Dibothriocephalus latus]
MAANITVRYSVPCMLQKAWLGGPTYKDFLRYNQLILITILGLPVCVVGIFTSGLSICMFGRDKTTPRTTRKLLIVLSVLDVLYLLLSMLVFQPMNFCGRNCPQQMPLLTSIIVPLGTILESFRNWLVVLIGVERFLVICFPVRSKVWWTGAITNRLIAVCFGFSILVRIPLISFTAIENVRPEWSAVKSRFWQLHCFTDSILVTLVPLIILIVCSVQIGRGLRRSGRFRRGQGEHPQLQTASIDCQKDGIQSDCIVLRCLKLTRGLLIVIITFALFMLPLSILQLLSLHFLRHRTCVYMVSLNICSYLVALGSQINSTANFFVYIVYWAKYRRMLRQMLGCQHAPEIVSGNTELTSGQH